ncbi:MAG: hypothetical protein HOP28_14230 [Gemmatimonadales bacterium]|nr:hypothetical protein [Gemmatimonadales bacterium]
MERPSCITRVIVVVLDGLRADVAALFPLRVLSGLAARGARTFAGTTVTPSVTNAAMASLLTGVSPRFHGLEGERFGFPKPRIKLDPLPAVLARHGFRSFGFMQAPPRAFRGLAEKLATRAGVEATFLGRTSAEILGAALPVLARERHGFFLLHWPEADYAGHAHGWTSPQYMGAALEMDAALAHLVSATDALDDDGTLLICLADHGGGGRVSTDHNSEHRLDVTIPIVLIGGRVVRGELAPLTSLLDVPATVAWALGATPPRSYEGRPLIEAFMSRRPTPAALAAVRP